MAASELVTNAAVSLTGFYGLPLGLLSLLALLQTEGLGGMLQGYHASLSVSPEAGVSRTAAACSCMSGVIPGGPAQM